MILVILDRPGKTRAAAAGRSHHANYLSATRWRQMISMSEDVTVVCVLARSYSGRASDTGLPHRAPGATASTLIKPCRRAGGDRVPGVCHSETISREGPVDHCLWVCVNDSARPEASARALRWLLTGGRHPGTGRRSDSQGGARSTVGAWHLPFQRVCDHRAPPSRRAGQHNGSVRMGIRELRVRGSHRTRHLDHPARARAAALRCAGARRLAD